MRSFKGIQRGAFALAGLAVMAATALTGCGDDGAKVETGSLGQELKGQTFKVGSKDFTENILFGHLTIQLLQAHGASAPADKINLKGTFTARKALTTGEIDMYWDYSGTCWIEHLKHTDPIPDAAKQFDACAKEDLKKNKITWIGPTQLNNTYALAIRSEKAKELGVSKLSDLPNLVKTKPNEATFCLESEFSTRKDGWPGMTKAYGISGVRESNIKKLATGAVYKEADKGKTCNFGEVFTTDARIKSMDLTLLQDDKKFFPIYNGALTMKEDTAKKHPQVQQIIQPLMAKLTDEEMQKMTKLVDVDGYKPDQAAKQWLDEQGFLKKK